MQYPDSAKYLYSLAKRARKYFLGLTIISQDVEDFLGSEQGRAILNNSSMQILLKQSPSAVEKLTEVFHLTEGEKFLLLESDVGEGLFFAGASHVAIKVVASYAEDQIITTDPRQLLEQKEKSEEDAADQGQAIEADKVSMGVPAAQVKQAAPVQAAVPAVEPQAPPTAPSTAPSAPAPITAPQASVIAPKSQAPAISSPGATPTVPVAPAQTNPNSAAAAQPPAAPQTK
jgi:hypothetical protein